MYTLTSKKDLTSSGTFQILYTLQTAQSNASHVLLRNVPTSISGKFACEVSADAPTFDTSIVAADMEVVGK